MKSRRMRKVTECQPYSCLHPLTQRELEVFFLTTFLSSMSPSCGTAMTAFQQVIVEYLPEHGQDPAMWKGRWWRKPLIMSKCSGKTPCDSPKELRQSKPSLSACFAEQADCAELRDDEKQDATACSAGDEL